MVAAQPVRSPWWTYADADATYSAASLNLLLGEPIRYLDHPGLPLEQLGATAFGIQEAVDRARGEASSTKQFVDGLMLDLDRARPVFRGLAIGIYLAGTLLSFFLLGRLFGHWLWGLAGGLAWVAAPGLAGMSIQFRPDVALAVCCLVFAYLVGRAVETRSPLLFAAAAFELGLATMVKMHAAGLVAALALAAVWRHPAEGWQHELATAARRNRSWLLPLGFALLGLALFFNLRRLPWNSTAEQVLATVVPPLVLAGYLELTRLKLPPWTRSFLDPFYAVLGAAFLAGLAVPIALSVPDGMQAMISIEKGLSGQGVNAGIELFGAPLDQFQHWPLRQALLVFLLAGVAAVVGVVRREPLPVVWFVGALALAVMAEARLAAIHYFAPAFVVALPGAFWLIRRLRPRTAAALASVLVVYLVQPQLDNRSARTFDTGLPRAVAPSLTAIEAQLRPGELAVTPSYWPHPDTRYFDVVQPYVAYTPPYPYRFVSDSARAPALAEARGLRLRYYTGPLARDLVGEQELMLTEIGPYRVRPLAGVPDAVELLAGPGTGP